MTESIIALIALSLMEIVLGIDNIVFISILTAKLPRSQQPAARRLGLLLALGSRIVLLSCIFWLAQLTAPVLTLSEWIPTDMLKSYFTEPVEEAVDEDGPTIGENEHQPQLVESERFDEEAWEEFDDVSWRDMILIAGGLFLIYNSVREIHHEVEGDSAESQLVEVHPRMASILVQIAIMDIVFSLDSVITAVGMANELWVMITAVVLAVGVMIMFANPVGNFVEQNPTVRMLAVNFLLLIGVMLVAEGVGTPINKGYIYFAMAFSLMVEFFNMRIRSRHVPGPGA